MAGNRVVNTDLDFINAGRIKQLLDGVDPQDAATVAQLNSVQAGLAWKDSVRVATGANINFAAPGASVDGVALIPGDRVLVMSQTNPEQNGLYVFNGAATSMVRAPDATTFDHLEQAVVTVEEGSSAGATLRQTQVNGTIDTDPILWTAFGATVPDATTAVAGKIRIATQAEVNAGAVNNAALTPETLAGYSGFAKRYATTFGDGAATTYVITHGLNTRDASVTVRLANAPYDEIICEVEFTSLTTVTIKVNEAPGANQYMAVVIG